MAQVVEQIDVTGNVTREVTLASTPLLPSEVAVDPVGGPAQVYGADFEVVGDKLRWDIPGSDILRVVEGGFDTTLRVIYEA
jgi:hypothetical protein